MLNNSTYSCRWSRTGGFDLRWREITFSFNRRHFRSGRWATEHYVRVEKELWVLQLRTPSYLQRHHETSCGIFYDVPLKLLRVLSCSRGAITHRSGVAAFDSSDIDGIRLHHSVAPIYGYYWHAVDDSLEYDQAFGAVQEDTTSSAPPPMTLSEEF